VPSWCWFVAGAAAAGVAQLGFVADHDGNPTALLQVGADTPTRPVIARDFPHLWLEPTSGHDGRFNYLIARQPAFWRADADTLRGIDGPGYRYTRVLYPLLAGLGGTLPPAATLAGLMLVQVLAGGAVAALCATFARRHGLSAWFVVANLFNQGVYSAAVLLTCDLTAHALALGGWLCAEARRFRAAAALFALALLAKEYYAFTPLALAAALAAAREWRAAAWVGVVPLAPVLAWKAAVYAGLGFGGGGSNFTRPGGGILEAAAGWDVWLACVGALGVALVGAALLAACSARLPARLRLACAAWGLLGLCTGWTVWGNPADLLRVILPAWWLVAWAAFAPGPTTPASRAP